MAKFLSKRKFFQTIELKKIPSPNPENFSTKVGEKETFITENMLSQNVMHITGNLLRDCKDRN